MKILQSTIERLLYILLLAIFIFNIITLSAVINTERSINAVQQTNKTGIQSIETEQNCIAAFFLQGNRGAITLGNLKICQPIVKKVQ